MKMILKGTFEEIIYKENHLFVKYMDFYKSDLFKARLYLYILYEYLLSDIQCHNP